MEARSRVTRNLPIKIVCPNTRHRLINQIIYEEFILALWEKRSGWARKARRRLLEYNIDLTEGVLHTYKRQIKDGARDPISASNFSGDVFGGTHASRYGKDGMYGQFHMWEMFYIEGTKRYVGLPANQLLCANQHYGSANVFACEKNKVMSRFMFDLQRHFSQPPYSTIVNEDIFTYLEQTDNQFSVFDFDLMCHANSDGLVDRLARCIVRTATDVAVINIATTVGRWIDEIEYRSIMPGKLVRKIQRISDFCVFNSCSGGYNDKVVPMRYEFLVIGRW
jgi:hypothetical protein